MVITKAVFGKFLYIIITYETSVKPSTVGISPSSVHHSKPAVRERGSDNVVMSPW